MRTCPNCNELNGENRTTCYKCKTFLGKVSTYKKICPECRIIYGSNAETCETCHTRLSVYSGETISENSKTSDPHNRWMYILAIFIPLVGIILGLIYISRKEDELGKSLLLTGIIANTIGAILLAVF